MGLDNPIHLLLLLVILLLVFGAKRLPEMGRSLGEGLRGFKGAISGDPTDRHEPASSPEATAQHRDAAPLQAPVVTESPIPVSREPTLVP